MNVCNSLATMLKCKAHHDINDVLLNLNKQAITIKALVKDSMLNVELEGTSVFS